VAQIDVDVI